MELKAISVDRKVTYMYSFFETPFQFAYVLEQVVVNL